MGMLQVPRGLWCMHGASIQGGCTAAGKRRFVRARVWACALPIVMACNGSSPTAPASPPTPQLGITFTVANPATVTLSEPERCPGDRSTCSRDLQPQSHAATSIKTTRRYTLDPGTYRLSGMLRPTTAAGASIKVAIGGTEGGSTAGSAVHGFGVFSPAEEPSPAGVSVVSESCSGTFLVPSGVLGWSVIFEVVASTDAASRPPCH
jgi:hypothetical protein